MSTSATKGVPVTLQNAQTSGNGLAIAIPPSFIHHKIIISWSAGVGAGAIQPENADNPNYSGTWAPVGGGPIAFSAASSEITFEFVGVFAAIRARISTTVTGGTVTVTYIGSN